MFSVIWNVSKSWVPNHIYKKYLICVTIWTSFQSTKTLISLLFQLVNGILFNLMSHWIYLINSALKNYLGHIRSTDIKPMILIVIMPGEKAYSARSLSSGSFIISWRLRMIIFKGSSITLMILSKTCGFSSNC